MPPWSAGRESIYIYLRERESEVLAGDVYRLPNDSIRPLYQLPFREMIRQSELFSEYVEPAVEDIAENDDEPESKILVPIVPELLRKIVDTEDPWANLALYQILVADQHYTVDTVHEIGRALEQSGILDDPRAYAYFVRLARHAPDDPPIRFALHMLGLTKQTPPLELVRLLGLHARFAAWAIPTIRARFLETEDVLMEIARLHDGLIRLESLEAVRNVTKPVHRTWLLRKGHKCESAWYHLVYPAAVLGDLVGTLRTVSLEMEELVDYATILGELSLPAGPSGAKVMEDYVDGPEACLLFIEHCQQHGLNLDLEMHVAQIVRYMETAELQGPAGRAGVWPKEARQRVASRGKSYLERPVPLETENAGAAGDDETPNVDWLEEGDVTRFREVLECAVESGEMSRIVDWTERMLYLTSVDAERIERRVKLEGIAMPGICSGGITALTDPKLNSIYGQLILQMVQALEHAPGAGWKIIQAALRSDIKFHRQAATDTLAKWDDSLLVPEVFAELLVAHRRSDDEMTRTAIERLLLREPAGGGVV